VLSTLFNFGKKSLLINPPFPPLSLPPLHTDLPHTHADQLLFYFILFYFSNWQFFCQKEKVINCINAKIK